MPSLASAQMQWETVHPHPPAARYSDAVYGEGVWVIAGDNVILTTADLGTTWSSTILPHANDTIDGVIYTGERFLAFGGSFASSPSGSTLLYESLDGIAWAEVDAPRITATGGAQNMRLLNGAVSADGEMIAIGGFQGALYTSMDGGDTWTARIYIP